MFDATIFAVVYAASFAIAFLAGISRKVWVVGFNRAVQKGRTARDEASRYRYFYMWRTGVITLGLIPFVNTAFAAVLVLHVITPKCTE